MSIRNWFKDFLGRSNEQQGDIEEYISKEKLQEIYYKELALQTAITLIANAIAKCEFKVYENHKEVKNHLYYKLNVEPNKNENSSQIWHKAIERMINDKESIVIDLNNDLYCADSYSVEKYPIKGNLYRGIVIDTFQLDKVFMSDEVLRFQLNNTHIKGLIDGLYQQYGELLSYAAKKYKNSNQTKYKLILDNIKASDENFQKVFREVLQKQLKSFMENDNAVYVQHKGTELVDFSNSNKVDSSDFRNLRKEMFEIVAQAFQIPTSLMLGNITNMNEVVKIFLTFCIDPIAEMIGEEITRKTSGSYENWKKGNYVKLDTSTINHIDVLDVSSNVNELFMSGTCCIDEIREILGFDMLNTDFSKIHFITKNYDTVENRVVGDFNKTKGGENDEE